MSDSLKSTTKNSNIDTTNTAPKTDNSTNGKHQQTATDLTV